MPGLKHACAMALLALLPGCVKATLAWTDLKPNGPDARPAILAAAGDSEAAPVEAWRARTPRIKNALQAEVYGFLPDASSTEIIERRVIAQDAFGGLGRLEEYVLRSTATFDGVDNVSRRYLMNTVVPVGAARPSPVILMQTFCPRWDTVPHPGVTRPAGAGSCDDGAMSGLMRFVFGRYIATPPIEEILARGYAVATIYPSELVPDSAEAGAAALAALSEGHQDDETRWGAIGAWAWAFSQMADVLLTDEAIDPDGLVVFGHSRYGKSALVAAAFDPRIDAVLAHQSGTGGASLNREKRGESVRQITDSYPHWFSRAYAGFAGREEAMRIDQHHLLALIAPRPILLGNARRDVWSDPNGAFRAALGADPVYEIFGSAGLDQARLSPFQPEADLSFWIRPGTHGVVKEDWPAFLDFLDAHFPAGDAADVAP